MKKDEKKLEDKEEKKNDELLDELERLRQDFQNSTSISDEEKAQVEKLIQVISAKASRGQTIFTRIKSFLVTLLFNFIGFYLVYGLLFKYINVTKLNALYLICGLSLVKTIIRMIAVCFSQTAARLEMSVFSFIGLVLITYLFSNLRILFSFYSFIDIILFYLIEQAIFEMMSITYTKINLKRMLR